MNNLKFLHSLRKKLVWLPLILLAACAYQSNTAYHSYHPVPSIGWDKSDTLVYTLPATVPAGEYEMKIEIRYKESYLYRNLWLEIKQNMQDTLHYATDTIQLFLADETGKRAGNSPGGLYQCTFPYKANLSINEEGCGRTFRLVQIMKDNPLEGISDVGIQLTSKSVDQNVP